MSVIQMKGELRDYYRRKVGEGKNKILVLKAVRNKLIHRVCSVVHRQQKYDKNYAPTRWHNPWKSVRSLVRISMAPATRLSPVLQ
ncbi:hypothetical protein [Spirosoma litoris]